MKPEQQRIAIAEFCGHEPELSWHVLSPDGKGSCISGTERECEEWLARMVQDYPGSLYCTYHVGAWKHYRHYDEDLNAMHEAENRLDVNQLSEYADALDKICVPTHICSLTHWQAVTMANAAQRAEAFLRALGKWVE